MQIDQRIRKPLHDRPVKDPPLVEQDAFVNILKAQDKVLSDISVTLHGSSLSEPQYNVLRILRGASPYGIPCSAISDRMITRQPDITRILDRLEQAGLIARQRSTEDRRVVLVRIGKKGMDTLAELDRPVRETHERQFGCLSRKELTEFNRLLVLVAGNHLEH